MADYVQHRGGQDVRDEDVLHALADASLHNGQADASLHNGQPPPRPAATGMTASAAGCGVLVVPCPAHPLRQTARCCTFWSAR